ncbi:bifunctional class I SAM-dependent methyltransferase/GNAT family N-acetyltransferase [Ensifer sp.]|uniref:bifunctional class I SAM-dependent methyltransferase/GNAT family N-acetyltransferase n=1 Tax=Ensifer sp. TaxID=1872086 RepID=UPI0028A22741|nr:bifunctional class I SAM-dependent methyltransferase/GNAT family N-acetyltransferase [Ensifer sp.]
MQNDLHEANRLSWNAATVAHNSHKGDQATFFRNGGSTLYPEEIELLGDLSGLDLLHLQCNAGQDSLSLARLGANVTGVDISDEAIAFATRLSRESGVAATFERADLFHWFDTARARGLTFDRVFASYGTICWLSDLGPWARGIASVLKPGGRFAFIEFHPFAMVFDEKWQPRYDYAPREPVSEPGVGDYVAASGTGLAQDGYEEGVVDFRNPHPSFEFNWGIADVVQALIDAGLRIECLKEYPYSNGWVGFEAMRDGGSGRMLPPEAMPSVPLMYAIAAARPKSAAAVASRRETVIRPYRAEDRDRLVDIWLAASRVGHPFLGEERLLVQLEMVRDTYLPMADNWVAEVDGRPAGFIGLIDSFIGGLFVDPQIHGAGIGRGLIEHAAERLGRLEVSVYADNGDAVEFYRRRGFVETGRQETDDEGLPFAVIHMARGD